MPLAGENCIEMPFGCNANLADTQPASPYLCQKMGGGGRGMRVATAGAMQTTHTEKNNIIYCGCIL